MLFWFTNYYLICRYFKFLYSIIQNLQDIGLLDQYTLLCNIFTICLAVKEAESALLEFQNLIRVAQGVI